MNLFGTGGAGLERRLQQPPGMHGHRPTQRKSVYVEQLREKQQVKRMYGLREDQFRRPVEMAQKSREQTGVALLKLLERRLIILSIASVLPTRVHRPGNS